MALIEAIFRRGSKDIFDVTLEITLRSDDVSGFEVIPWRWVIERTFAWLGNFRRLSKDYEFFCENSEGMIYIRLDSSHGQTFSTGYMNPINGCKFQVFNHH